LKLWALLEYGPMGGKVEAGPVLVMLVAEGVAWCKH